MCIAILNISGLVPEIHIRNSFDNNYDGCGLAWIEAGKIKTYKTMKDLSTFIKTYKQIRQSNTLPILLHFRISTHGKTNLQNVHPFMIGEKMAMIHNGMIDFPLIDKDLSDTHNFSNFLSKMSDYEQFINPNSIESQYIQDTCGNHSKMVFLSSNGKYQIYNEDKGHWIDDSWYSNYTYQSCGLYDFGGKSTYKNDWSDYEKIDSYTYDSDSDFECLQFFADEHEIDIQNIDPTGADWDDYDMWERSSWIEVNGKWYVKDYYMDIIHGDYV
jgi:predicted glutamine amidotransferase